MKVKLSKKQWEDIGRKSGWISKVAYSLIPPAQENTEKMCERCGVKPSGSITDPDTGEYLGEADYCQECDDAMDNGPIVRLIKNLERELGPDAVEDALKEILGENRDNPLNLPSPPKPHKNPKKSPPIGPLPDNYEDNLPF